MSFFRGIKALFYLIIIVLICVFAAALFNQGLSEKLEKAGDAAISAISELSDEARENLFSEEFE